MKQIRKLVVGNRSAESKGKPAVDVNYLYSQLYIGKITLQEYLSAINN